MKYLVVAAVFVCMLVMCSEVNAHGRVRKILRAPIHLTQRTVQTVVNPIRVVRKNIRCRVEARRSN